MTTEDTIAAISSAVGPAARMILRMSGPDAPLLARTLGVDVAQSAARSRLTWDGLSVPAWVYWFRGPHSYTGQDLVEFHIPGSPVLAKMLLAELLRLGARPAEAGEFTARAYFNGRMDLTAAEGVAATIAASGEREMVAARQLMAGELARRLTPIMDEIAQTLALVEIGIDFSQEDVTFLSSEEIRDRIDRADRELVRLLNESARFERLAHEPVVVLVGRPNAGKSTLLNALAGRERAIVSPVAGTTRDALSVQVKLARGMARLVDVAGLDEQTSVDPVLAEIEHKMQRHARQVMESADAVVLIEAANDHRPRLTLPTAPAAIVRSKGDLLSEEPNETAALPVSAVTGEGLHQLLARLDIICFGESSTGSSLLALNLRHVRAIDEARTVLSRASDELASQRGEVIAFELREALEALGSVLGRVTADDLLGRIFSGFCIGK